MEKKINEKLYKDLEESLTVHHESGSITTPLYDEVEDVHDTIYNHYNVNELQHYKATTIGLYAFDQKIEDIFDDVLGLECKTITEQLMLDKINYLKSIVFRIEDKKQYCMPDNINTKEEHEEYLRVIGFKKRGKNI